MNHFFTLLGEQRNKIRLHANTKWVNVVSKVSFILTYEIFDTSRFPSNFLANYCVMVQLHTFQPMTTLFDFHTVLWLIERFTKSKDKGAPESQKKQMVSALGVWKGKKYLVKCKLGYFWMMTLVRVCLLWPFAFIIAQHMYYSSVIGTHTSIGFDVITH